MPPERRLPLWSTIREATYFPWHYRQYVGVWVLVFGTASTLIGTVGEAFFYWENENDNAISKGKIFYTWVSWIPDSILFTIFAVLCHRMLLIGEPTRDLLWTIWWTKRETRFCILVIGVYIVVTLLLIPVLALILLTFLAALKGIGAVWDSNDPLLNAFKKPLQNFIRDVGWGYFLGRLSLMFPAIAVDLKPTLVWAWATSMGNGWRLAILVGTPPFVLAFVNEGLIFSGLDQLPWILSLVQFLLWYIVGAIEIAVLSIAFRELTGWHKSKSFEELQPFQ